MKHYPRFNILIGCDFRKITHDLCRSNLRMRITVKLGPTPNLGLRTIGLLC